MRFNCGPTWEEKQMLSQMKEKQEQERLTQWHPFFCLWPRRCGKICVWLETIERKGVQRWDDYGGPSWSWSYRTPDQAEHPMNQPNTYEKLSRFHDGAL
jgi:hypothetical protein